MIRCMLDFGYIGTQFRGAQRLWNLKPFNDPSTIEGNLELAFMNSAFKLESYIEISSRTDSGVHALHNVAHVDLSEKSGKSVDLDVVRFSLNKYFSKQNLAIVINQAKRVNSNFDCRKLAKSRTYLFRLAVIKEESFYNSKVIRQNIEEWRRSYLYLQPDWDIEKFREGAKLLVGKHDFESFRKANKTHFYQENIKTLLSIDIEPSRALRTRFTNELDAVQHYDIIVRGKSFVHNQIRRMVAALNCVACGQLSLRDLQIMLQVPSKHSWPSTCNVVPPYGLYLSRVEYDPQDLLFTECDECPPIHDESLKSASQ